MSGDQSYQEQGPTKEIPFDTTTAHAIGKWLNTNYQQDITAISQAIAEIKASIPDDQDVALMEAAITRLTTLLTNLQTADSVGMDLQVEGGGLFRFHRNEQHQTSSELPVGFHKKVEGPNFTALVRTLGHEVNTPLNALGLADVVAYDLPASVKPAASTISSAMRRMNTVVRNTVDRASGLEISVNEHHAVTITPIPLAE